VHNFLMSNFGVRSGWIKLFAAAVASAALLGSGTTLAAGKSTKKSKHSQAASSAEAAEGEIKFNTFCRQCHSFLKDDNRLGPSLYGVIGRTAGTAPGYLGYSSSMKMAGWIWTRSMIDKWITNPYKILPDTNMRPFPGVPDAKTRKMIIAFLASHHDPVSAHSAARHSASAP
jgi:cytochrome c